MSRIDRIRRAVLRAVWRLMNPAARALVAIAPWWVTLETTGRKSGLPRETPLARGPQDDTGMWLIAVHGRHSLWVQNIGTDPVVRLRRGRRWLPGTATVHDWDPEIARRFNLYARSARRTVGIDPALVRVEWADPRSG